MGMVVPSWGVLMISMDRECGWGEKVDRGNRDNLRKLGYSTCNILFFTITMDTVVLGLHPLAPQDFTHIKPKHGSTDQVEMQLSASPISKLNKKR